MPTPITVTYSAIDGFRKSRTFKTLAGARKFATDYVGEHPEMGSGYAVAGDGVGKVVVRGCTLAELFAEPAASQSAASGYRIVPEWDGEEALYRIFYGERFLSACDTATEAAAYVHECEAYDAYSAALPDWA